MSEVKTTFAAHSNPWAQLIKPEPTPKPKMQKQAKQPVKPAAQKAQPVVKQTANKHTPESVANAGWIKWNGGECPVKLKHSEVVEVKYRNGYRTQMQYPELQPWMHFGCEGDIIAYRVINKQSINQSKPAVKTGQPAKPKLSAAQASARIDPENLVVTDMPFLGRTVSLVSKYAAKFATLPVNHRLVCESQDAPAISKSLKQWAEKNKPGHVARHVRDCGDGMGGVWLLKAEK